MIALYAVLEVPSSIPGWKTQKIHQLPSKLNSRHLIQGPVLTPVSMLGKNKSSTWAKCVACFGLLLTIITSSINSRYWQELAFEGCTFHTILYHTITWFTEIPLQYMFICLYVCYSPGIACTSVHQINIIIM